MKNSVSSTVGNGACQIAQGEYGAEVGQGLRTAGHRLVHNRN